MSDSSRFFACILAGGSGERFWPMSRAQTPKHLLKLFSDRTLLEETVRRIGSVVPAENVFVLTNAVQLPATRAALAGLIPEAQIIAEPAKRDTAPAAALATAQGYVASGNVAWNAGMFFWRVSTFLEEAQRNAPELAKFVSEFPNEPAAAGAFLAERFPTLPKISVDYAIMEKARNVETLLAQ